MACKFPGAPDLASFWRLLESGGNAITEGVPGSGVGRIGEFYPESARQNPACHFAALVDDIDLFDADFFRISPAEAQLLDPQQRMVLETVWQALEDALVDPERLRGSRTGVYVGISNNDYRTISLEAGQPTEPATSLYTVAGTSFNTAAGRVAYALGLNGPAMAVDTACSSSLFALHQGVASLQRDEADLIVVGGVQAIFLGRLTQLRANARMLSPDGQCKAFDASANGFVRGEGCGMVVLKRLSDAQADGDRIWGVVLGSAVNQDGASAGLTVPSGPAQTEVIEEALLAAGVEPNEVDYLEAHGTGTEVGDPIELNAAIDVYGKGRGPENPLLVGSVKTNVGHLEPAAGVAGLMKVLLSMHRGIIPKHLHFNNPNPRVDWDNIPVKITSETTAWPEVGDRLHRAGISSYGWSGTNVHVIVEAYPGETPSAVDNGGMPQPAGATQPVRLPDPAAAPAADAPVSRPARLLPLAGKTDAALRDLAKSYLAWLDEQSDTVLTDGAAGEAALSDMAWSASVARSHFDFRKGVVFRDAQSLRQSLRDVGDNDDDSPPQSTTKVAFAYTGQGNQWVGMGEGLYDTEPVFRAVLDRCDRVMQEERGVSLLDVMFGRPSAGGDLDEPQWTQPAIYALECALTALWDSVGVRPDVVIGHSLGEIAAAQAAGVFSLEDGLRFASARGRLLGALPRAGAMAAVFAQASQVEAAVNEWNVNHPGADVVIGVDNGTHQVVSGPAEEVHAFADLLESAGVNVRRLRPSPAYHSPLVEPALDDLEAVLDAIPVTAPSVRLVSNLTGSPLAADERMDGAYWRRHARQPVAFRRGVEALAELGVDAIIELGPHAVLGPLVSLNWTPTRGGPTTPVVLQSLLRPSFDGSESWRADAFPLAVAGAYEAGLPVDLAGLFAGEERRKISVPGYAFQRRRYWVTSTQRRRPGDAHPLLGAKHESPRDEVMYETEMFPSDPQWLKDHRVYGRVVMPGAVYGAMAATAPLAEGASSTVVEELQLHNPLVYPEYDPDGDEGEPSRRVQMIVSGGKGSEPREFEVYSKGRSDEGWTLHAEGRLAPAAGRPGANERVQVEALTDGLQPQDLNAYYRAKAATGIDFGPFFRTVETLWCEGREAVGEVALQGAAEGQDYGIHPLLLDGCFQVLSATRTLSGIGGDATYLPFACERLWLNGPLPERIVCYAQLRESAQEAGDDDAAAAIPETLTGDLTLYSPEGFVLGGLAGFVLKRATRASLLSSTEGLEELLYEVVWRERPHSGGIQPADFLESPTEIDSRVTVFADYLRAEDVDPGSREALLNDLERLSWSYALQALEELGWERKAGASVVPEAERGRLEVLPEHEKLFRRLFDLLARAGVAEEKDDGFVVAIGPGGPQPEALPGDPEAFADWMAGEYPHGEVEIGLIRRSGGALAKALTGQVDPLTLLFSSGDPTPADLYLRAPVAKAANKMLADAVAVMLDRVPPGRQLRVIEIGAGTGSATASVLPELPAGLFTYTYTDISAGFFAEAEARFGGGAIEYRILDIERDPVEQGFAAHGYDILVASNVLHATRYLEETLAYCRQLLAPSGQLLALENLRGQGWLDLTFGQLDGWWRFADDYRPHHALADPAVWKQALVDAGFVDVVVLGPETSESTGMLDRGVMVAQGPEEVVEAAGVWVVAEDGGGVARQVAAELTARNQIVVLASDRGPGPGANGVEGLSLGTVYVDLDRRESWEALLKTLPADVPFNGAVHFLSLDGHGTQSTTAQLAEATRRTGASGLALIQGLLDADAAPEKGVWFITRGAQNVDHESLGEPSGSILWGVGKVVAREAGHLQAHMLDLAADAPLPVTALVDELLYPDDETHVAYRRGTRQAARLTRAGSETERLALSEDSEWLLSPDADGDLAGITVDPLPRRALESNEIRVAVEAAGLNFWDVFRGLGLISEGQFGGELCGRVIEAGEDVSNVAVGDRVVGLAIGAFSSEAITRAEMVTVAPPGMPLTALATVPVVFASAALSYELSGLYPGDRVLIHAGAGGVGMAAIQLAQAAGAEVFATASAPKHAYLRSLGVEHVFDSRQTAFGKEILEATNGEGVTVVLNSLTGEGFIEASLACLAQGGRFVEMARVGIYSEEEMAQARPDVAYAILRLDALKEDDPMHLGAVLSGVMDRIAAGELSPLVHSRWSMADAPSAMKFMRAARHIGKIVLATSSIEGGQLRNDRTYLVTGGLGGIGCVVAEWLADRGAGAIALNGRRSPDPEAEEVIESLRGRGHRVEVQLADVTDPAAVDAMLARIDATLPPLAGVIHSVGVLSDGAFTNQSWEKFETVLWPKILGAWQLHRATMDRDLDLFVLFSSLAGVTGNPGQANHAAANAFLDQLAGHRRALGLPGQTIAWGAWAGLGEAEEQRERIERQLASSGVGWMTPQQGIRALDALVRQDVTTGVVAAVDWPVWAGNFEERPLFLEDLLVDESAAGAGTDGAADDDVWTQLKERPAGDWEGVLVTFLQRELQAVLRSPSAPAPNVGFFDLGMDSLMSVELRNRMNRALAGQYVVSNTAVFDYPTVASLAAFLTDELGQAIESGGSESPAPAVVAPQRKRARTAEDDPIAIVGMACRFPGAPDLASFWTLLESGTDAVTDGRQDDGPWEGVTGDPAADDPVYRMGGFVEGIDQFDHSFFRISPIEARTMDPQQRMLLETTWHALEDAGIDPDDLKGSRTGVYVGIGGSEYREVISRGPREDVFFGTTPSVAAGRVAFVLGLEGPAMPVDMACASSIGAVHQASAALQSGEVDVALASGTNALLSLPVVRLHRNLGMLSAAGRCNSFDASADGYVRGEGCGVLVLKRLSKAEADGDRIWGLVIGSAVNQNGASAGLPVPRGPAQERVMEDALARAGVAPSEVDYLEAHGTGTALGDSIELRAVASVYGQGRELDNPLLMGSVKTNIGHVEWAAGMASIIKAVLGMQKGVIPAHLHFQDPNPNFEWDRMPLRITSQQTEWPSRADRRPIASVNSFGLSGANAHVVLEGYGAGESPVGAPQPVELAEIAVFQADGETAERTVRVLPLSAKTPRALRAMAGQYVAWLDEQAGNLSEASLADMTWTAAMGRSHLQYRAGLTFRGVDDLRAGLQALAESIDPTDDSLPPRSDRTAFVYTAGDAVTPGMTEWLYRMEPVVRDVLNRCDLLYREEQGVSLLDGMLDRDGAREDPALRRAANYALQAALTALWGSVGVRPSAVLGQGAGEIAAAQAAGAISLEEGLRLAAALSGPDAALPGVSVNQPSMTWISSLTGGAVRQAGDVDVAHWRKLVADGAAFPACVEALAATGVDLVIGLGTQSGIGQVCEPLWPTNAETAAPTFVDGTGLDSGDAEGGFHAAVARAYEAGTNVAFEGMFAGEMRRRVSLPSYPFQRRRHWV